MLLFVVLGLGLHAHEAQGDSYANTPYGRFPRVAALPVCSTSVNFNKTYVLAGTEVPWHCDGTKYRLLGPALPVAASTGQRVGGQMLNNGDIFMTFTPRLPGTIEQVDATSRGDGSGGGTVNVEFVQGSTVLCTISAACNIAPNTALAVTVCPANVFADFATAGVVQARYATSSDCTQNPSFQFLGSVLFFLPSP